MQGRNQSHESSHQNSKCQNAKTKTHKTQNDQNQRTKAETNNNSNDQDTLAGFSTNVELSTARRCRELKPTGHQCNES